MSEDQRLTPEGVESWAWGKICAGEVADFSQFGGGLDPLNPDDWDARRILSSSFLRKILFREPYRSKIPVEGVRIVGARFLEKVDLAYGHVERRLWLFICRFEKAIDLSNLRADSEVNLGGCVVAASDTPSVAVDLFGSNIQGPVELTNSIVKGQVRMAFLQVQRSLYMNGTEQTPAKFKDVDLRGARVGGDVRLEGATIEGPLDMVHGQVEGNLNLHNATVLGPLDIGGAQVQGNVYMPARVMKPANMSGLYVRRNLRMCATDKVPAMFKDVDLNGAKVEGEITFERATVEGLLEMSGIQVGRHLYMHGSSKDSPANFRRIELRSATVGGYVSLDHAVVNGSLDMSFLVSQNLYMRFAKLKTVDLDFSLTKQNLNLAGAELKTLDLSEARIEGALRLGSGREPPPSWGEGSHLGLRNTHVATLQDWWVQDIWDKERRDAWPPRTGMGSGNGSLELQGFTYARLGGFGADTGSEMQSRLIDWYIDWLARDPSYSPQPYVQLASTFRNAGAPEKANQVLYAGRERARREARSWLQWLWLSTLKWVVGYGIGLRYFYALGWVLLLTAVGTGFVAYGQRQGLVTYSPSAEVRATAEPRGTAGHSPEAAPQSVPSNGMPTTIWPAKATDWSDRLLADVFYSLDELLPIVTLDPAHDKVELGGGIRYYFMLHRLLGFLLGGFLAAGLAGLTQK
jgi:uncharacterized protein YjbI with pentapeptide repeats